jgi:hypothetical protein
VLGVHKTVATERKRFLEISWRQRSDDAVRIDELKRVAHTAAGR